MLSYNLILVVLWLLLPTQPAENLCVLHLESLHYHHLARVARIQGEVRVQVTISPDGKVVSAHATTGHQLLRQQAQSNIQKWVSNSGAERTLVS